MPAPKTGCFFGKDLVERAFRKIERSTLAPVYQSCREQTGAEKTIASFVRTQGSLRYNAGKKLCTRTPYDTCAREVTLELILE